LEKSQAVLRAARQFRTSRNNEIIAKHVNAKL
jgi:hypothetical protein